MSDRVDTTAARALADAATPGPWIAAHLNPTPIPFARHGVYYAQNGQAHALVARVSCCGPDTSFYETNAEFIAAARTLLPALCDELNIARARIAQLEMRLWRCVEVLEVQQRALDALTKMVKSGYPEHYSVAQIAVVWGHEAGLTAEDMRAIRDVFTEPGVVTVRGLPVTYPGIPTDGNKT